MYDAPHVVTWELTRACQLHCRHCRAQARVNRDTDELTVSEISQVMNDLAQFEWPPIIVFTGGDPLERPDLPAILSAARARGLRTAVAPSVTPRLTAERISEWKELGVSSVALSLDGATEAVHDGFRGAQGIFRRTLEMARAVVDSGLRLQINSSVAKSTAVELEPLGDLVKVLKVSSWEIFFVVPTGRAAMIAEALEAEQIERHLTFIAKYAQSAAFRVTVVAAPQYQRVVEQTTEVTARPMFREGRGVIFIDRRGLVFPSGYLPVVAGNLRRTSFSEIYQESPTLRSLRDPNQFSGRCGTCQWSRTCGGSRARAFAVTGDMLQSDPGCILAVG